MSLYIISQNKNIIKKVNDYVMIEEQVTYDVNNPNKNVFDQIISGYVVVVDNVSVARYKTKEKAEKIVEEIQHLSANKVVGKGKDGTSDAANVKSASGDIFYEMPKDTPPTQKENNA